MCSVDSIPEISLQLMKRIKGDFMERIITPEVVDGFRVQISLSLCKQPKLPSVAAGKLGTRSDLTTLTSVLDNQGG